MAGERPSYRLAETCAPEEDLELEYRSEVVGPDLDRLSAQLAERIGGESLSQASREERRAQ